MASASRRPAGAPFVPGLWARRLSKIARAAAFLGVLVVLIATYLLPVEALKRRFYRVRGWQATE